MTTRSVSSTGRELCQIADAPLGGETSFAQIDRYLELAFRFNNRNKPFLFRDTLLRLLASGNIEYNELTKKEKAA